MKPSEKTKQDNEKNAHYSQENTMKIEKILSVLYFNYLPWFKVFFPESTVGRYEN